MNEYMYILAIVLGILIVVIPIRKYIAEILWLRKEIQKMERDIKSKQFP